MLKYNNLFILIFILITTSNISTSKELRIAVLKFGSVNWELDVINHHHIIKDKNIKLKIIPLTNKDATTIAFLSKEADIIVTDWIWVNRQRAVGKDFTLVPYSSSAGSLMVKNHDKFKSILDLKDAKVGIAGSSLDKSWLLLRAYGKMRYGEDLEKYFKPSYAAPPLINGLIENNGLDASFNYWNYSARLKAKGYKEIIKVSELLPELGIDGPLPLIGYVFRESFAKDNNALVKYFLKASQRARSILKESDDEWLRIKKLTGASDNKMLFQLRDSFRDGIPNSDILSMEKSIKKAYQILSDIGGKKLVGKTNNFVDGTIWKEKF